MFGLQRYPEGFVFRSHGMRISALPALRDKVIIDNDVPKGTVVGHIDFTPNGFINYNKGNRRYATRMSILGMNDFAVFLDSLHEQKLDQLRPEILEGKTNETMVFYAERFGFTIEEYSRSFITGRRKYKVAGETDKILSEFEDRKQRMEQKGIWDRLLEQDSIKPPFFTRLQGSTREIMTASFSKLGVKNLVTSLETHTKLFKIIGNAIFTVLPMGIFAHLIYERLIGNEAKHRIIYDLRSKNEDK